MELQFKRRERPCLEAVVREVRNMELTQEIRLPDGMPDIGHIVCAWGQTVLRGKEWRTDSIAFSGGMMVWILYAPDDGSGERCIDGWIPFQMRWDLPEGCPEGTIRIRCLPRFVDARSVSARKLMVRAGTGAQAEAFVPRNLEFWEPEGNGKDVELLQTRWPVRVPMEAGEKQFLLDEEPELSGAAQPESIISYRMEPRVAEKKVLGNKLVFRGNGNLHLLCRCSDGRLRGWDVPLPFSQFTELDGEYGTDAQADLVLSPTNLELELGEAGRLRFKGGVVAQYLVADKQILTTAEDAYSPEREVKLQTDNMRIPAILETRQENLYGEQSIAADAEEIADIGFLPEFPRIRQGENGIDLELPGQFQVLYYGTDGTLRAGNARWEGTQRIAADDSVRLWVTPGPAEVSRAASGNGQIGLSTQIPMEVTAQADQQLPMITGLELGEVRSKDPERPSLVLRRAGEDRLWDIAKETGSTMEAIRRINGFSEEPAPDRMLLIPVR